MPKVPPGHKLVLKPEDDYGYQKPVPKEPKAPRIQKKAPKKSPRNKTSKPRKGNDRKKTTKAPEKAQPTRPVSCIMRLPK